MSEQIESVDFYWRPGCGFCMALDRKLTKMGILTTKYNIWDHPEHAAFVREHANGAETVPTVAVGRQVMVNPSGRQVLATLESEAPHLIPEGTEVPEAGRIARAINRILGE